MKKRIITILIALMIAVLTVTPVLADDLVLENKNPADWSVIEGDGIQANLNYNPTGPQFDYHLIGAVSEVSTYYSLIYYADPWPGNNPGALIGTGASDGSGNIDFYGSTDLGDIPADTDANYENGAKVWLIPSICYDPDTNTVIKWQPGRYLFEYELITYQETAPQPVGGVGPSWLPTPSTFILRFGGQYTYNWIDGNTLPAIDQVSDGYWNGIPYTLRVVIPAGTEVFGGYCLQLCKKDGVFTFRNIDGTPIGFSNPVIIYQMVDGEWEVIGEYLDF